MPWYAQGMYITVRVRAGARREELRAESASRLLVSVKEESRENHANRRVMELVAAHFKVSLRKVRIVRGHRSPAKLLSVEMQD